MLWLDQNDPSLSFGPWHTHTQSLDELWSYIEAIESDLLLLITDRGGPYDGQICELDLRDEHALLEYMAGKDAPPRVSISTFTGAGDREYP